MHRNLAILVLFAVMPFGAAQSAPKPVQFPVVIEDVTKDGSGVVAPNETIFSRSVRSTKAVRLKSDFTVAYKAPSQVMPAVDRKASYTVRQGTVFVVATGPEGEMYCAAIAEEQVVLASYYYDVALCLRDTGADGLFDQALVIEPLNWRIRTPYEIRDTGELDWMPVAAAYDVLAAAAIPASELRLQYYFQKGGWLSSSSGWVEAEVCWAKPLALANAHLLFDEACGELEWFSHIDRNVYSGKNRSIQSREMVLRYELNSGNALKTEVITSLQSGPATLGAVWARREGGNWQRTVVNILPSPAETAR